MGCLRNTWKRCVARRLQGEHTGRVCIAYASAEAAKAAVGTSLFHLNCGDCFISLPFYYQVTNYTQRN